MLQGKGDLFKDLFHNFLTIPESDHHIVERSRNHETKYT